MDFLIEDISHRPIVIPGATQTKAGVVTLAEVIVPDVFVTWASLGFFDNFSAGGAPFGAPKSRVVGDTVQLAGLVIGPPGGTGGNYHCTTLPAGQRPSVARVMTASYQVGANPRVLLAIAVDNGAFTGTPGAVIIGSVGSEIPAGGALISLDGLSFLL